MAEPVGDLKVCPACHEPVVWTFEFPGAEYVCVVCGWLGGMFGAATADATPELVARAGELREQYERARAQRQGVPYVPPQQDVPRPTCVGCGKTGEGRLDHSGKPPHWYSRTKDGVKEFACSRGCIPERESVMPW